MNDRSGWLRQVVRPLIFAVMLALFGVALTQLATLLMPAWDGRYVAFLFLFLVLETHLSHRFLKQQELRGGEILQYRLAEAALLFLVARLTPYLTGAQPWSEVLAWGSNPQLILMDGTTWVLFLVMMVLWQSIHATLKDFDRIDGAVREEAGRYSLTSLHHDRVALQQEQMLTAQAHHALFNRYLQGGAALLVMTGISRVGVQSLTDFGRASVSGIFWQVGLYFLCGLLLMGLLRYSMLRRRWQAEYVTVDAGVARGWLGYLAALLGVGAIAALLLPTGYSLPFLGGIAAAMEHVFTLLAFAGLFLFAVVTFPLVWGMWLVSTLFGNEESAPEFTRPSMPPAVPPAAAGYDWIALVRAAGVWILLGLLVWFVLRTYLRGKEFPRPRFGAWWAWLKGMWEAFRRWFSVQPRRLREAWQRGAGLGAGRRERRRHERWVRANNPIVALYLRLLRRAETEGAGRRADETPYEFDEKLSARYPDVATELEFLTDAFVEARYSEHPVSAEHLEASRAAWRRVQERLKQGEGGEGDPAPRT